MSPKCEPRNGQIAGGFQRTTVEILAIQHGVPSTTRPGFRGTRKESFMALSKGLKTALSGSQYIPPALPEVTDCSS
jgi:hypothetical protein